MITNRAFESFSSLEARRIMTALLFSTEECSLHPRRERKPSALLIAQNSYFIVHLYPDKNIHRFCLSTMNINFLECALKRLAVRIEYEWV